MVYLELLKTGRRLMLLADTHFNHKRLIEEGHRPLWFTEMILAACIEDVTENDILVFLGDVILGHEAMLSEYMSRIPGWYKVLVRGNHDNNATKWYLQRGFHLVCDQMIYDDIVFTHIPLTTLPVGCRLNIHGHLHNDVHRFPEFKDILQPWHKLVALENTGYRPVPLESVV